MGITSSLNTGLTGLASNQSKLDVVGNNIANVNTVGFKSSRLDFKTQFLESLSYGTAPDGTGGGTNPIQIGLGTQAGAISRNFGDGSLQVTGVNTNLAVQGNGFFVVKDGSQQVYTRDGTFQLNGLNQLVSSTGQLVQGFDIDSDFNIVPGVLTDINIPLGSMTVAQPTQNVTMSGNLNTAGALPSVVSNVTLGQPLYLSDGVGGVDATNPPTNTTVLTNVTNSTGTAMFQNGDVVSLAARKGTRSLAPKTFTVTAATTLADMQNFMNGSLGLNTAAGANGAIATIPGTTIPATGNNATLTINGNPGTENDLTIPNSALSINRGGTIISPFTFTKNAAADGASVYTAYTVYDSLGTALTVSTVATLQEKTSSGSTWKFYAESPDNLASDVLTNNVVGSGTISFDTSGQLLNVLSNNVTIDRAAAGSQPNLSFDLNFDRTTGLSGTNSQLASTFQDGSPPGVLSSFSIGNDGIIAGSFSNGLSRKMGQVALATFRNNQGLVDRGSNTFVEGPNSGNAIISAPAQFSAGRIISGALELSNVDLSAEFVQLITASTGFSASSRVITTSNQLMQELLAAAR